MSAASTTALDLADLARFDTAIVVLLGLLLGSLWLRARGRLRQEGRAVLRLLASGAACWVAERLVDSDIAYLLCNTLVAASFALAGHALFGLQERLHPLMRPREDVVRDRLAAVDRVLGARGGRTALLIGFAALLATACTLLAIRQPRWLWDLPAAVASCLGMVVLGLGLWREFTREKRELVSLSCGAAIALYGVLQLVRVVDAIAPWVQLVAVLLKVVLLVAVASFWTLVREMARAQREEAQLWRPEVDEARSKALLVDAIQHDVLAGLHGTRVRCALAGARLRQGDASGAAALLDDIDRDAGEIGASVREKLRQVAHPGLNGRDLHRQLLRLLHSVQRTSRREVHLDWRVDGAILPEVERALLAIARAACRVADRGSGTRLHVACRSAADHPLGLEFELDGAGADGEADAALVEIRRAALALGARLSVPAPEASLRRLCVEVERWRQN